MLSEEIVKYHREKSIIRVLEDRCNILRKEFGEELLDFDIKGNETYVNGNVDKILHYEGLVRTIKELCKTFKPPIEKTPFEYNEYLNARLGGMSHQEIIDDQEIRNHYDFSKADIDMLNAFDSIYYK